MITALQNIPLKEGLTALIVPEQIYDWRVVDGGYTLLGEVTEGGEMSFDPTLYLSLIHI